MQGQIQISSPRAPRSSHHRSSSTRTSPRQRDRVRSSGGQQQIEQPDFGGSPRSFVVPENLDNDRETETFNVDPTSGTLEAGGETYQPHIAPAGRNVMGGIVGGLRKAWQRNRAPRGPGIAYPEPAVVHEEETQYESVPRAEAEMQYTSPAPNNTSYDAPLSDGGHTEGVHEHYTFVAADGEYPGSPERDPHHRQESSSSTSETIHVTTQEHYEGTTAVNHGMIFSDQIGSPELVEPRPASDYAKMDSPPRSEASFGSYLSRIHRFFQTIHDLPWIAPDRVTVDYVPGKARQQAQGGPTLRARPARKPAISWYNSNIPPGFVDLLSSGTASSHLAEFPQAKPMATPSARYTDGVVYANNLPTPATTAGPPPMSSMTQGMVSQPTPRPRRVPAPQITPDLAAPADGDAFNSPRYPNGYVPFEQLSMQQTYTGSSAAPSVLPPQEY